MNDTDHKHAARILVVTGAILVIGGLAIAGIVALYVGSLSFRAEFIESEASTPLQQKIPVFFQYHIPDNDTSGPFTLNNGNDLLSAAIIGVRWNEIQPDQNRFTWTILDKKINDWTANGTNGKKVLLKIVPYNQTPRRGSATGDNEGTPSWVYTSGVPRITFSGGGQAGGEIVSVPKTWDPHFMPAYTSLINGLAQHYGNDARIAGIQAGFGHLGTFNAQPSGDGGRKFVDAGWTLGVWESYAKNTINAYRQAFPTMPLYLGTSEKFLEGKSCGNARCGFTEQIDTAKRILDYGAGQGVSVIFGGLRPGASDFQATGIPDLVRHIATLQTPANFSVVVGDDWPLWAPESRSNKCPSPTCGRDLAGFEQELQQVTALWNSIGQKFPLVIFFQEPETTATNQSLSACRSNDQEQCFNQSVRTVADRYLATSSPRTTAQPTPTRTPNPYHFNWRDYLFIPFR